MISARGQSHSHSKPFKNLDGRFESKIIVDRRAQQGRKSELSAIVQRFRTRGIDEAARHTTFTKISTHRRCRAAAAVGRHGNRYRYCDSAAASTE